MVKKEVVTFCFSANSRLTLPRTIFFVDKKIANLPDSILSAKCDVVSNLRCIRFSCSSGLVVV